MPQQITLSNIEATALSEMAGPKILSVSVTDSNYTVLDDTAVSLLGGYIKITGSGFESGAQLVIGSSPAVSVTVVNSTELRCQLPSMAAGSYVIQVLNPGGVSAFKFNGVTYSAVPSWVTGSSLSGSNGVPISTQLTATSAISYSLTGGSSLPAGLTLFGNGLLAGTVTVGSDTTYNFTVNAVDAENQDSPRTFSLSVTTFDGISARYMRLVQTSTAYGQHSVWQAAIKGKTAGNSNIRFLFNDAAIRSSTVAPATSWGQGFAQLTSSTSNFYGYLKNTAGMVTGDYFYYISEASSNISYTFDFGSALDISEVWVSGDADNGYDYWSNGYVQFSNNNVNWSPQYALAGVNAYANIPSASI